MPNMNQLTIDQNTILTDSLLKQAHPRGIELHIPAAVPQWAKFTTQSGRPGYAGSLALGTVPVTLFYYGDKAPTVGSPVVAYQSWDASRNRMIVRMYDPRVQSPTVTAEAAK